MHRTDLSLEFFIFLIVGLVILVFEAARQFNKPAYTKPGDGDEEPDTGSDLIFSRTPQEISSRTAYFSAGILYVSVIVLFYLAFIFFDAFNDVFRFILQFGGMNEAQFGGGDIPDTGDTRSLAINLPEAGSAALGSGDAVSAAIEVPPENTQRTPIERDAVPFVVSVTLVTALRFPGVRKVEVWLRHFAQSLFGIPRVPHRLRQKIEDKDLDLAEIEEELPVGSLAVGYSGRIESYLIAAEQAGVEAWDLEKFKDDMSKLAAYQIWVRDLRIWPSAEFRSQFEYFQDLSKPLSDEIDSLMKHCELLTTSPAGASTGATSANNAVVREETMKQEVWELKVAQARSLLKQAAGLMALYDQNSTWPNDASAGAGSLKRFLEEVRAKDSALTVQKDLAILLIIIGVVTNAVAGAIHANWLLSLAENLGLLSDTLTRDSTQFSKTATAMSWAFTSLICYGVSILVAIKFRHRFINLGHWSYAFEKGKFPPMLQYLLFFAGVALAVIMPYFLFLYGVSTDGKFGIESKNLYRQLHVSSIFAIVGAWHGTWVVLMMDMGRRKDYGFRAWLILALVHLVAMTAMGMFVGDFQPTAYNEIRQMRQLLYGVNMGAIALFTSIAMAAFLRPDFFHSPPPLQEQMLEGTSP